VLKRHVAFVFAVMSIPSVAWASAWTLPEGTGQWVATLDASTATEFWEKNGALAPTPRYNKVDLDLLVEYGVTDQLTLIFNPGLQHIDIAPPISAERTGLDYTEVGARYAFFQDPTWVLSGQATLRIPGAIDASNPAAIGYTDVESDIRLLLGHSFTLGDMASFFDIEVAERARTAGLPSEFRVDATLGTFVAPRWLLLLQSFNVVSEGAGNPAYTGGSYDYEKVQLSAVYALTPTWSLQGGGYTTYAGRNALEENGVILGVWHRF
jgi:protein XagA